jgi:hypothetical protein
LAVEGFLVVVVVVVVVEAGRGRLRRREDDWGEDTARSIVLSVALSKTKYNI